MQQPTIVTKLSELFEVDAKAYKVKYNFEFQVLAFRKISRAEMQQAFRIWKSKYKGKTLPKNKIITFQSIIGFDGGMF
ncbi:MAG: hypothetical protein RR313_09845 [Anaerovoracaceae bacterium]